ncbi:SAM-dependent methyltransferase [Deinococcus metalli]|uniref:SAM-dependent methyltransferase n=1 Tax=Deinococcus metalli TaxID=1141878 RepID=A0A7W8KHW9_9DEIO|nr:class I SAM-dependent methyltransferase [Deinococcus metalli]MBB5378210.1 SAM-dependent methyltransferase [Deinococcus metalli]
MRNIDLPARTARYSGRMAGDHLHFDRVAALYHAARPAYPAALYDQLEAWGALRPGMTVLELGPGTGQATRDLLARGVASIDAVELGDTMAAYLRRTLPDPRLTVIVGNAHDVRLPDHRYDLAVAATSFHWLDPAVMVPKLARATRAGAALAVWWTLFGDPAHSTPFRTGLRRIEEAHGLVSDRGVAPLQLHDRTADLQIGGFFGDVQHALFRWSVELDAAQATALFGTFPTWAAAGTAVREVGELVQHLGGSVTDHFMTALYGAWRGGRAQ